MSLKQKGNFVFNKSTDKVFIKNTKKHVLIKSVSRKKKMNQFFIRLRKTYIFIMKGKADVPSIFFTRLVCGVFIDFIKFVSSCFQVYKMNTLENPTYKGRISFTGAYFFFLFWLKNTDSGNPQSIFLSKSKENITDYELKNDIQWHYIA